MTSGDAKAHKTQRIYLDIEGMTCGFCVRHVEKALNKIDGVSASVHLPTKSATVDIDGDVETADLCAAVAAAGYSATLCTSGPPAIANGGGGRRITAMLARMVTLRPRRFQPDGGVND
ncbi:heavy metal-associated domain-containing protein [Mycolicibacterium neoaurum]|uniref:heavy-metal-associated domain-containing protein n=1 Tax=Mycolicibacterium neoaurum TaxID=1795 RepID=UPI00248D0A95|nr:heavy metal-associated domain-containing protein [Mycolicibacterium neoaurum]WBP92744.1 heavy metal-associated domain-containing protein [Mycolicibacterium neoaurum]WBS06306.1 heavy metal-associated domain-containing protein [Mycolicibacterium neoaurum]